jgi:hypothetical protein
MSPPKLKFSPAPRSSTARASLASMASMASSSSSIIVSPMRFCGGLSRTRVATWSSM